MSELVVRTPHAGATGRAIENVQILRGIAAMLVIFVHMDVLLPQLGLPTFGESGVHIFFVISGFIMVHTTTGRNLRPWPFIAKRVARIIPAYWATTAAVFAIALTAPALLQSTQARWNELVMSLTFIPFSRHDGVVSPILFVGWTLNYEMFFYALFAIGLCRKNKTRGVISVSLFILALTGLRLALSPDSVIPRFYTSPIMLDFVIGMMLGLLYLRIPRNVGVLVKLTAVALIPLGILAATSLPVLFPYVPGLVACGLPAGLVVICAVASEIWGWSVRTRWLLILGDASYAIYLTHPFVTQIAQKLAVRIPAGKASALALIVITLVSVCLAGMLFWRLIERPLSGIARQVLTPRRLGPPMTYSKPKGI